MHWRGFAIFLVLYFLPQVNKLLCELDIFYLLEATLGRQLRTTTTTTVLVELSVYLVASLKEQTWSGLLPGLFSGWPVFVVGIYICWMTMGSVGQSEREGKGQCC